MRWRTQEESDSQMSNRIPFSQTSSNPWRMVMSSAYRFVACPQYPEKPVIHSAELFLRRPQKPQGPGLLAKWAPATLSLKALSGGANHETSLGEEVVVAAGESVVMIPWRTVIWLVVSCSVHVPPSKANAFRVPYKPTNTRHKLKEYVKRVYFLYFSFN